MSLLTHERETYFVSFCTPHACVTVQTLTRWILSLLEEAGVDTSKWKSHAVRSASALHHRRNLSVLQIQKLADWSATGGVFRTFYEKYLWSPSFLCNIYINWYRFSLTVVIIFRHVWWINWLKIPRFLQAPTFFSLCVRSNVRVKEMLFHVSLIYLRYCTRWFKWKIFLFLTSRNFTVLCEIHWVACYKFKILASPPFILRDTGYSCLDAGLHRVYHSVACLWE